MDTDSNPRQANNKTAASTDVLNREELIQRLVHDPASINREHIGTIRKMLNQSDWMSITRRIFDINEGSILNRSTASLGLIGKLNRLSQRWRNSRYYRKIHAGFRTRPNHRMILAEGDSWFEYPLFILEIIDWLSRRKNNAVYSLAYGADWLSNMIYENKYIEALPVHEPDFFLISGGGNDMLGEQRLATVLRLQSDVEAEVPDLDLKISAAKDAFLRFERTDRSDPVPEDIIPPIVSLGNCYLKNEFQSLLKLFEIQYTILLERLQEARDHGKFERMSVLTQGYDYPIPNRSWLSGVYWWWPWNILFQAITNALTPNGIWLIRPMMTKGIANRTVQRAIMFTFIQYYNQMLIELVNDYSFAYHIDCRGMAPKLRHWYNELHPHSGIFKRIAHAYQCCMENSHKNSSMYPGQSNRKVIVAREFAYAKK